MGRRSIYATEETAYLLPYVIRPLGEKRVDRMETVNMPFLAEPDQDALRYVVEHVEAARERGRWGREHVRGRLTWERAVAITEAQLVALCVGERRLCGEMCEMRETREAPQRAKC